MVSISYQTLMFILRLLLWALFGCVLFYAGITYEEWPFWAILAIALLLCELSALEIKQC
jgi:hypothetical protein